jgi:2-phosphosulfolactate phosphatase
VTEFSQDAYDARFDWGMAGLLALAPACDAVVIVDVLSFSTAVDVAAARGAAVYPCAREDAAAELAREHGAKLATRRARASAVQPWSLSPGSLASLERGDRLVLWSPNGAVLSVAAAERAGGVFAGCLRNARATARAARAAGERVAVIAAGERWPNDALRPALEDLLGAGAILAALEPDRPSPEARAAIAAFRALERDLAAALRECASGRELVARGYPDDARMAAELDASDAVPRLAAGAYRDSSSGSR